MILNLFPFLKQVHDYLHYFINLYMDEIDGWWDIIYKSSDHVISWWGNEEQLYTPALGGAGSWQNDHGQWVIVSSTSI